ncbi:MAG: DUF3592 domain-containing protein [Chloroflexi bacterium]|nr:MAG: DUF3592 domain-containing protein [Chloroflexota bacterium]
MFEAVFVIPLIICAYGVFLVKACLVIYYLIARNRWRSTDGKVVHAKIVKKKIRRDRFRYFYQTQLEYDYFVDDVLYHGHRFSFVERINFGRNPAYSKDNAEFILRFYPVNSEVSVLYNPRNPSQAVIEKTVVDRNTILLFLVYLVMTMMLICVSSG